MLYAIYYMLQEMPQGAEEIDEAVPQGAEEIVQAGSAEKAVKKEKKEKQIRIASRPPAAHLGRGLIGGRDSALLAEVLGCKSQWVHLAFIVRTHGGTPCCLRKAKRAEREFSDLTRA